MATLDVIGCTHLASFGIMLPKQLSYFTFSRCWLQILHVRTIYVADGELEYHLTLLRGWNCCNLCRAVLIPAEWCCLRSLWNAGVVAWQLQARRLLPRGDGRYRSTQCHELICCISGLCFTHVVSLRSWRGDVVGRRSQLLLSRLGGCWLMPGTLRRLQRKHNHIVYESEI